MKNLLILRCDQLLKELCEKLLELVGAASPATQQAIITALPEVLDDSQHQMATAKLMLATYIHTQSSQ